MRHTTCLLKHTTILFFGKNANLMKILKSQQLVFLCKLSVIFSVTVFLLILHISLKKKSPAKYETGFQLAPVLAVVAALIHTV